MKKMNNFNQFLVDNIADKNKIRNYVLNNQKKERGNLFMKKGLIYTAVLLAVLALGGGGYYYQFLAEDSFITLDINPSIELVANRNGDVLRYNALNEDAELLLSDMDLENKSLEEVTEEIIGEATDMGYIDETDNDNAVLVTVYEDEGEKQESLLASIEGAINRVSNERSIDIDVKKQKVIEDVKNKANELDISTGKMMYIEKMASEIEDLSVEDLAQMNMRDINKAVRESKGLGNDNMSDEEQRNQFIEEKQQIINEQNKKVEENNQGSENRENSQEQNGRDDSVSESRASMQEQNSGIDLNSENGVSSQEQNGMNNSNSLNGRISQEENREDDQSSDSETDSQNGEHGNQNNR